jgi:hypothetical protein
VSSIAPYARRRFLQLACGALPPFQIFVDPTTEPLHTGGHMESTDELTINFVAAVSWLVLWGVSGWALGSHLRRQPEWGMILGAFLGPVGLVMITMLTDKRRRCKECRGVVFAGGKICPHCRSPLA